MFARVLCWIRSAEQVSSFSLFCKSVQNEFYISLLIYYPGGLEGGREEGSSTKVINSEPSHIKWEASSLLSAFQHDFTTAAKNVATHNFFLFIFISL